MNRKDERATLAAAIAAHLPALEQRLRKQELTIVVDEALGRGDVSPAGFLGLAEHYAQRASARQAQLAALRAEYEHAHTPAEHTEVLARALREEKAPRRTFAALRRGWLDLDTMAERAELEVHELMVRQALATLDSLAIACPVISTTFASVPSLCGAMSSEGIGWLLIDEAGQATPQAAAGAIWRARRAVVVGDPLQLEPVVTLPRSVEASLAACNGRVNSRWHPSRTSVQKLADQTTAIGTTVGEGDDAIWVGAPLRVHRRCDEPMFSISNEVAYDGLMVHHKKPAALTWPASYWLDVPGGQGNGNWIPAEGEALRGLIQNHQPGALPRPGRR